MTPTPNTSCRERARRHTYVRRGSHLYTCQVFWGVKCWGHAIYNYSTLQLVLVMVYIVQVLSRAAANRLRAQIER